MGEHISTILCAFFVLVQAIVVAWFNYNQKAHQKNGLLRKTKKLIDASCSIIGVSETDSMPVTCDLNTYRSGDGFKLNISNVAVGNGGEMNSIVETVISELIESYPMD